MARPGGQGRPAAHRHHDFFSLYVVRRGRGTHAIDGVPYGAARGDAYAMGPGQTHWFEGCDRLATNTLHLAPHVFDPPALTPQSMPPPENAPPECR